MRLRGMWSLCVLVGALVLTSNAYGQEIGSAQGSLAVQQASPEEQAQLASQKEALAESMIAREEMQSGREFDPAYRAQAKQTLASLSLSALEAQQAKMGLGTNALGNSGTDLVYTPIAPCRIIDTRSGGGAIAASTAQNFFVAGTTGFPAQGGTSGGCGVPFGATSAMINFVAVNGFTPGDLRVTPFGTAMPLASVLNWALGSTGLNLANGLAVKLCDPAVITCTSDITLQADASAIDIVADVQGYFMKSVFGLPTRTQASPVANIAGSCGNGGSLTYTAPRAGKLLVRLDMTLQFTHTNGTTSEAGARIGTTAADCTSSGNGNIFLNLASALPTGTYFFSQPVAKLFDVVAGANTFYANAFRNSGTVAIYTWAADATFTPN